MKLSAWRKSVGKTQQWVASQLNVDQGFISRIERAIEPQTPKDPEILKRIYILSSGLVQPNDFYPMDEWEAARIREAAEAEMARAAA